MAPLQFHNVKDEKANAMRRYRRKQKLENALRLFKICVTLFVFSRTSLFPIVVQIFGLLYSELVRLFKSPFFVFILGNVIILFVYLLSDPNDGKTGGRREIYDEFVNNSESRLKSTAGDESPPSSVKNTEELSPERETATADYSDKKMIWPEVESPVSDETVTAITETMKTTATTTSFCTTVSRTANGEKVSERKCYRRVQSESFERRIVVRPLREMKRVNTEVRRETLKFGGELEKRLCAVENLSTEEFNRTVEDFIAKHKRKQREEYRELKKPDYLALTQ